MAEVQFKVKEAAGVLELDEDTVLKYCRETTASERRFPRARLLHNSRKKGYRIPEGDLLAYARTQGDWLVDRVERAIARKREEEDEEGDLLAVG